MSVEHAFLTESTARQGKIARLPHSIRENSTADFRTAMPARKSSTGSMGWLHGGKKRKNLAKAFNSDLSGKPCSDLYYKRN